ncbi:MAG: hypothetical protein Q8R83_08310 [Legionellaceae bacterium]|nr:hypothetical protein [Legionellaceae bacterium]
MIDKQTIADLQVNFFGSAVHHSNSAERIVKETLLALMADQELPTSWYRLRNVLTFKSMMVERDPALLRGMRNGFRTTFIQIFEGLKQNIGQESVETQRQKLSKCLSILPFTGIIPDDIYDIPEFDDDGAKWNLVKYRVKAIELTPTRGPGAFILKDYQRLFAYGLEPECDKDDFKSKPQPHLIFMDTLYPHTQSFSSQLFADLEWFAKAGSFLAYAGKAGIGQWLSASTTKAKTTHARIHAVSSNNRSLLIGSESFLQTEFDSHIKNNQQTWLNFGAYLILRNTLFGLFALRNCLVLPVCRAILEHKTELLIIGVMTMAFIMLPGLLAGPLGISATVLAGLYIGSKLFGPMRTLFGINDEKPATFHAPDPIEMKHNISPH